MMKHKTNQEVQKELEAAQKKITALQNKQMHLNLLHQFQQQGVTRPDATGFVVGNDQSTKSQ
jgi:hypothetical protein